MSLSPLDRRTLLRSGALVAGSVAFTGLTLGPAGAAPSPSGAAPVTGALIGWLVTNPDGGQINLIELDARSQPLRLIASETILPTSLAGAARQATAAALRSAAASWGVSAAACACGLGRIEHPASGRSIPFAIWTDFA